MLTTCDQSACRISDNPGYGDACYGATQPDICSESCGSHVCAGGYCQDIVGNATDRWGPAVCDRQSVVTSMCQPGSNADDCALSMNYLDDSPTIEFTTMPGSLARCQCLQMSGRPILETGGATTWVTGGDSSSVLSCPAGTVAVGLGVSGNDPQTFIPGAPDQPYRSVLGCRPLRTGLEVGQVTTVATSTHDSGRTKQEDVPGSNPADSNWSVCPADTVLVGFCNADDDPVCQLDGQGYEGLAQCATLRAACPPGQARDAAGACLPLCGPGAADLCTCGDGTTCRAPATCAGQACQPTYCPDGPVTEPCHCAIGDVCQPSAAPGTAGTACVLNHQDGLYGQCLGVCSADETTQCWCPASDGSCLTPNTCGAAGCEAPPPTPPTPPPSPTPSDCTDAARQVIEAKSIVEPDCGPNFVQLYPPGGGTCDDYVGCETLPSPDGTVPAHLVTAAPADAQGRCDLAC